MPPCHGGDRGFESHPPRRFPDNQEVSFFPILGVRLWTGPLLFVMRRKKSSRFLGARDMPEFTHWLCNTCQNRIKACIPGYCSQCGAGTSYKAYRYCKKCAKNKNICDGCGTPKLKNKKRGKKTNRSTRKRFFIKLSASLILPNYGLCARRCSSTSRFDHSQSD